MMDDSAAQRRALFLFEQLTHDRSDRTRLTAGEPESVIIALRRLELAEERARLAFPTAEDPPKARIVMPLPDGVGAYRFTGLLGEGGMGIVFAAERSDGLFEHAVAIKLIHPDRLSASGMARFEQERRLLARLDHPGIARLIDGGVTDVGWPYIIMERIEGLPIDRHIGAGNLPKRDRVTLLIAVGRALRAAHTALIVHGDIKPDNILVHRDGGPRLLDFGVARFADGEAIAGFEPRTLAFAAPERRAGEMPTIASDIFAMGVLMRAVLGRGITDAPSSMVIDDADLSAIADKAAADDVADRYGAVDALVTDLERWSKGLTVMARPATAGYTLRRFVARNRRAVTLSALAVAGSLFVAILAAQGWRTAIERVADVRGLTHYQLVVLDRRLDGLPETVALRAELAAEAQSYLERLAEQPTSSPSVRYEAADGFRRLALLQGASDRPSLGNPVAARTNFARALALLGSNSSPEFNLARQRILIDAARMEVAHANIVAAKALLRSASLGVAAETPRILLAELYLLRSEILQWDSAYPAAFRAANIAGAMLRQQPLTAVNSLLLARSQDLASEADFYAGRRKAALSRYRHTLATLEYANSRWPKDRAIQWSLTKARWALGTAELDAGNAKTALPLVEAAFIASNADALSDPADHIAWRRRNLMMLAYGQAQLAALQPDEGIELIERSIAERRNILKNNPFDASAARDLLSGLTALGEARISIKDFNRGCSSFKEAITKAKLVDGLGNLTDLDKDSIEKNAIKSFRLYCKSEGENGDGVAAQRL